MRTAEQLRREIGRVDELLTEAAQRRDEDHITELARQELALCDELDQTTIPITRQDVRSAITALTRWAEQCAPGPDTYLRKVITRLREAGSQ